MTVYCRAGLNELYSASQRSLDTEQKLRQQLEQEVELLLEAAWEALEASVALYAKQPERAAERADAHGRLADAALQNDQPERAADEYAAARAVLDDEVKAGRLTNDDRRLRVVAPRARRADRKPLAAGRRRCRGPVGGRRARRRGGRRG